MELNEIEHNRTRKKAMIEALEKCYGIVTKACNIIGLARTTHYEWLKNDEDYRLAVEELENVALDHSEDKLHQLIEGVWIEGKEDEDGEPLIYQKEPNVAAVIFHLKTRGRKRGYSEREPTTSSELETMQPPNVTIISKDMSGGHGINT